MHRLGFSGTTHVHLVAASTVLASTCVGIAVAGVPAFAVGLSIDELDVMRTLSVTVSSSVLRTSLVARVLGKTTVLVHLNEVQSTVQTAGKLRDINVELSVVRGPFTVRKIPYLR